jgi:putative alpha-1,2-mannosidase
MGGRAGFTAMLDRFFSLPSKGDDKHQGQEGLIGQYAHGNEPSHHIAWAYAWSDRPERAPELIREIATRFYDDTPSGITGNDDCGQMSAWYVLATLGFYQMDPVGGRYVLGRPLAKRAEIALPGGRSLKILAGGGGPVRLNGRMPGKTTSYAELMAGGTMAGTGAA